MNDLEEFNYFNELYVLYKNLLTDSQKEIMDLYYLFNLSLGEISKEKKISRSAALDSIEKSRKKLLDYENKLNLYKKTTKISDIINKSNLTEEEKSKILEEL